MGFQWLCWYVEVLQRDAGDGVFLQQNHRQSQESHSLVPLPMELGLLGWVSVGFVVRVRLLEGCFSVANEAIDPNSRTRSNSLFPTIRVSQYFEYDSWIPHS